MRTLWVYLSICKHDVEAVYAAQLNALHCGLRDQQLPRGDKAPLCAAYRCLPLSKALLLLLYIVTGIYTSCRMVVGPWQMMRAVFFRDILEQNVWLQFVRDIGAAIISLATGSRCAATSSQVLDQFQPVPGLSQHIQKECLCTQEVLRPTLLLS